VPGTLCPEPELHLSGETRLLIGPKQSLAEKSLVSSQVVVNKLQNESPWLLSQFTTMVIVAAKPADSNRRLIAKVR
jgi:hypothetical protein